MSPRQEEAEMENLGRYTSTELKNRNVVREWCYRLESLEKTGFFLPSVQFVMPVFEAFLAEVFLHLLQLSLIRQNDQQGGVAFVGQPDDRGEVIPILVEVIASGSFHEVHSHLGVLVHVEVSFVS